MLRNIALLALAFATTPAAAQDTAISERIDEPRDILGNPQCRFRAIPELVLTDKARPYYKSADFTIAAREGKKSSFHLDLYPDKSQWHWNGISADLQLFLESEAHRDVKITDVLIFLDDQELSVPVVPKHDSNPAPGIFPGRFHPAVYIEPANCNDRDLIAAVTKGSRLNVRLFTAGRFVSSFTFDVSRLRHVPAALAGAGWKCK